LACPVVLFDSGRRAGIRSDANDDRAINPAGTQERDEVVKSNDFAQTIPSDDDGEVWSKDLAGR